MSDILVAISTVADGSMYNRHDMFDADVIKNRETFLSKQGISMDRTTRVHITFEGEDYRRYNNISESDKGRGMRDDRAIFGDAIVTTDTGHALLLPVADCIGTVLYDPVNRVLMLSHLGRHSLEQEGGRKSVEFLSENYKSKPTDLLIWLTPAASKDEYPLWNLDNKSLKEVMFEQLLTAGISKNNIVDNPAETTKDPNYYSFSEYRLGRQDEDADFCIVAMMT